MRSVSNANPTVGIKPLRQCRVLALNRKDTGDGKIGIRPATADFTSLPAPKRRQYGGIVAGGADRVASRNRGHIAS